MPSSQLQDPDYKLRHAGKSRAPELPMREPYRRSRSVLRPSHNAKKTKRPDC